MMHGGWVAHLFDYLNDRTLFPKWKSERNVPQYKRKKEQGRNEPCLCGSGKKYKSCCGQ